MRRLWILIFSCLLAAAAGAQTSRTLAVKPSVGPLAGRTLYTNSHALLIGVSRYQHLPPDRRLRFADKDALALRDMLVKNYGFPAENIKLLLNEQATKAAVEKALSSFADAQRVGEQDRLLVYFSGHGQTVTLPDAGEMGFLIPYDARVDLNAPRNAGPYLDTCVEMEGLWKYLRGCPAKHALVLTDACFSGLLVQPRSLAGLREKLNAIELAKQATRKARQVLTAGSKGEEVFEDGSLGHGAFTYKLLEELRAEAAVPGEVFTATDLAATLKRSVSNLTEGKQSPQFGSYRTEGEFLFVVTPTTGVTTVPQKIVSRTPLTFPDPSTRIIARTSAVAPLLQEAASIIVAAPDKIGSDDYARLALLQSLTGDASSAASTFAQARQSAMETADPQSRMRKLVFVARARLAAGAPEAARALLEDAQRASMAPGFRAWAYVLASLGEGQMAAGDYAGARETAARINPEASYDVDASRAFLTSLVERDLAQRRFTDARQSAALARRTVLRFELLGRVGAAQVEAGDRAGAAATLAELKRVVEESSPTEAGEGLRSEGYLQLGVGRQRLGDLPGARSVLRLARQAAGPFHRSHCCAVLHRIAVLQERVGDPQEAAVTRRVMLEKLHAIPREKAEHFQAAHLTLVEAQVRDRQFDAAAKAAARLTELGDQVRSLAKIAIAQAEAGKSAAAAITLETARTLVFSLKNTTKFSGGDKGIVLASIPARLDLILDLGRAALKSRCGAVARNCLGDLRKFAADSAMGVRTSDVSALAQLCLLLEGPRAALEVLKPVEKPSHRRWVLHDLARAMLERGDPSEARRALTEVLDLVKLEGSNALSSFTLAPLASEFARAGDIEGARKAALLIEYPSGKVGALLQAALIVAAPDLKLEP